MHVNIVTIFPEWFESPLRTALLGRAVASGLVSFALVNPRDGTRGPHHAVDDRPYGGGPGMVMMPGPLADALRGLDGGAGRTVMLSASGRPFTQSLARELAREERITLVCGRYEGIDARLQDVVPMEQVAVGEAVLNGGEAAAMTVIEAATRLIPGFMGKEASGDDESFSDGLLEYPHYTRPEVFEGLPVPEILRTGDHARIAGWRRERALETTLAVRPEMLTDAPLSRRDVEHLRTRLEDAPLLGPNLHILLVQAPVMLDWKKTGPMALTIADIGDISSCSRRYAVADVTVVAPQPGQREAAPTDERIRWADSLAGALASLEEGCGMRPTVVYAEAPLGKQAPMTTGAVRRLLRDRHVALVFGTGFGLAPDALGHVDARLRPIRVLRGNNHLPARTAAPILTDRLLGEVY